MTLLQVPPLRTTAYLGVPVLFLKYVAQHKTAKRRNCSTRTCAKPHPATLAGCPAEPPADPLLPLQEPTWLVIRDKHSLALEWRRLRPGTDLRAILTHELDQRSAAHNGGGVLRRRRALAQR